MGLDNVEIHCFSSADGYVLDVFLAKDWDAGVCPPSVSDSPAVVSMVVCQAVSACVSLCHCPQGTVSDLSSCMAFYLPNGPSLHASLAISISKTVGWSLVVRPSVLSIRDSRHVLLGCVCHHPSGTLGTHSGLP